MKSPLSGLCRLLLFLSLFTSHFSLTSCDDYDKWTTSPDAQLTFSSDTVAFDTVVTTLGSSTRTLIAFNHGDKGLRIRSVELAGGATSPFRVNVDGQYLYNGVGEDFEVRRKDSIYVRIEVTLPDADSDDIHHHEDVLRFTLESGVVQQVPLTAEGLDVIMLRAERIAADRTLDAQRPYLIYDSLVVETGATLTLPAGCRMMFHDGTSLIVHGSLQANGTLEDPVIFRGDRTDRMFPYLPYDNTPNRWGGIRLCAESHDNVLTQCDIHSGDYGILCEATDITEDTPPLLLMDNCIVHNIGGPGLQFGHCRTQVTGTQVSNTMGNCVNLTGGGHTFIHCTFAQFYPFSGDRGHALFLCDDEGKAPILWSHFINCVITGYAEDVVMGKITDNSENPCDYLFQNCLLRTVVSDDLTRFVNVRYDNSDELQPSGSGHFTLFDTTNFLYDLTPRPESIIRGMADPEVAALFPTDRRGTSRLADGQPDTGAYEGQ